MSDTPHNTTRKQPEPTDNPINAIGTKFLTPQVREQLVASMRSNFESLIIGHEYDLNWQRRYFTNVYVEALSAVFSTLDDVTTQLHALQSACAGVPALMVKVSQEPHAASSAAALYNKAVAIQDALPDEQKESFNWGRQP